MDSLEENLELLDRSVNMLQHERDLAVELLSVYILLFGKNSLSKIRNRDYYKRCNVCREYGELIKQFISEWR